MASASLPTVQREYTFRSPFQSILIVPEHSWEGESQPSCLLTQDALSCLASTPHQVSEGSKGTPLAGPEFSQPTPSSRRVCLSVGKPFSSQTEPASCRSPQESPSELRAPLVGRGRQQGGQVEGGGQVRRPGGRASQARLWWPGGSEEGHPRPAVWWPAVSVSSQVRPRRARRMWVQDRPLTWSRGREGRSGGAGRLVLAVCAGSWEAPAPCSLGLVAVLTVPASSPRGGAHLR